MKLSDKQEDEKLESMLLHGMSLEVALKRAHTIEVESSEPGMPEAGRKKGAEAE